MRQIGSLASQPEAERFGDYLVSLGVANQVEHSEASDTWAVWVEDDDQLERASVELASFTTDPSNDRYAAAVKKARAARAEETKAETRRRKNFVDVRTRWATPKQWAVPVTLFLITASVVVGVVTRLGDTRHQNPAADVLRFSGVDRYFTAEDGREFPVLKPGIVSIVRDHQYWRLITPIFLHLGILHLVFNLFWVRDLGAMIESRRGSVFMALIVFAVALISNFAEAYVEVRGDLMAGPGAGFGGLSGVVYGLFGYAWVRGRIDPGGGIGIPRETAILMMVWLFACMTGFLGAVANTAHVAGLVVGLGFGYVPYWARKVLR